jgi:DNA-binding NarL/FixJ family response regulator
MNDTLNDTIVDHVLLPAPTTSPPALPAEDLLRPDNPAEGLLSAADWRAIGEQLGLSARERSVARLIFEGNSRFQIAKLLACAEGTVRVYIDRVFAKLNVADRLGVALRLMRVHLALCAQAAASQKDATCIAE